MIKENRIIGLKQKQSAQWETLSCFKTSARLTSNFAIDFHQYKVYFSVKEGVK